MCHPVGFWTVFDQNWPDGTEFFIRRRGLLKICPADGSSADCLRA